MECSICLEEIEQLNEVSLDFDTIPAFWTPPLFKRLLYKNKPKPKHSNALKTLSCGHSFHVGCINDWIKTHQSCPYCRHFLENKFSVKVILNGRTISRNSVLEIKERSPKKIYLNVKFSTLLGKKKTTLLSLTRFNIINVRHNNRGMIKLNLYKTLHASQDELKLFIYNKNAREHIYDQFVCVIKRHYISNSNITFSDIDEEEALYNAIEPIEDNLYIENDQPLSILSNQSSLSSLSSLSITDTHILSEIE
jgi:hypothetical protein